MARWLGATGFAAARKLIPRQTLKEHTGLGNTTSPDGRLGPPPAWLLSYTRLYQTLLCSLFSLPLWGSTQFLLPSTELHGPKLWATGSGTGLLLALEAIVACQLLMTAAAHPITAWGPRLTGNS